MNKLKYSLFNRNIEPFNNSIVNNNDNTITIKNQYDMNSFINIKIQKNKTYNINIGNAVKKIPEYAFMNIPINGLTFDENSILETIGVYAFTNAGDNLSEIVNLQIPGSVKTINEFAFAYVQITNNDKPLFDVNGSLKTIGNHAFYNSIDNLSEIVNLQIPGSVTTINNSAFAQVQIINKDKPLFVVDGSLKTIGSFAFYNDTDNISSIKNLQIPGSVTTINISAFKNVQITNDESAQLFDVNGSLNTIDVSAFYNDTDNISSIKNLRIPGSVTTINDFAFFEVRYCNTNLQEKYGAKDANCKQLTPSYITSFIVNYNKIPFKKIIIFIIVVFFIFIVFKKYINLSF
jgi:hypothetical protein